MCFDTIGIQELLLQKVFAQILHCFIAFGGAETKLFLVKHRVLDCLKETRVRRKYLIYFVESFDFVAHMKISFMSRIPGDASSSTVC